MMTPDLLRAKLKRTYPTICKDTLADIERKVKEVFDYEPTPSEYEEAKRLEKLHGGQGGFIGYASNSLDKLKEKSDKHDHYSLSYLKRNSEGYECEHGITWKYAKELLY